MNPPKKSSKFLLSIIIPVYNEEKSIAKVIEMVKRLNLNKEIVIVDDGSTDGTREILTKTQPTSHLKIIFHPKNRGKGAAIRTGLKHIRGEAMVIQDADFEYNPRDYEKMVKLIIDGADVVYGTRLAKMKFRLWGRDKIIFPHFYLGVRFLSWLTSLLYGIKPPLTDVETCYKMLSKKAYRKIKLTSNRFEIEIEITCKLLKNNFKIVEIPISYKSRGYAEGKKIHWQDGVKALLAIIKYRFTD